MKPLIAAVAVTLLLADLSPAAAQGRQPLTRGDVSGTAGWLGVNTTEFDSYNNWHGQALFTVGAGWYWTDHLKTDIEFGASTTSQIYSAVTVDIAGRPTYVSSLIRFRSSRVAVLQRYQFGRNQWFHPSVGAGVDIVHRRSSQRDEPVYGYDPFTRQNGVLRQPLERSIGGETDVRAAAIGGFKAYITPRAFFLSDMRVTFTSRPEDVLLRVGFGVDF